VNRGQDKTKWRRAYNWNAALAAFKIHFGDRLPDTAIYHSLLDTDKVTPTLPTSAYTVNLTPSGGRHIRAS
jgi:hypothetical protein